MNKLKIKSIEINQKVKKGTIRVHFKVNREGGKINLFGVFRQHQPHRTKNKELTYPQGFAWQINPKDSMDVSYKLGLQDCVVVCVFIPSSTRPHRYFLGSAWRVC